MAFHSDSCFSSQCLCTLGSRGNFISQTHSPSYCSNFYCFLRVLKELQKVSNISVYSGNGQIGGSVTSVEHTSEPWLSKRSGDSAQRKVTSLRQLWNGVQPGYYWLLVLGPERPLVSCSNLAGWCRGLTGRRQ